MPKVKLTDTVRIAKAPPIDWLWAAILERKMQFGWDLTQMAGAAGTTYAWMRENIRRSPWEWNREARERLCKNMGISIIVEGQPKGDVTAQ